MFNLYTARPKTIFVCLINIFIDFGLLNNLWKVALTRSDGYSTVYLFVRPTTCIIIINKIYKYTDRNNKTEHVSVTAMLHPVAEYREYLRKVKRKRSVFGENGVHEKKWR